MHLYTEAKEIAADALRECECESTAITDREECESYIWGACDGHEVSIYYGKAIEFCAEQNTGDGEGWLEDCGGIAQPDDTFGAIACRVAFATLYCAAMAALDELLQEKEEDQ